MRKPVATLLGFLVAPLIASLLGAALTPTGRTFDFVAVLGLVPFLYIFTSLATLLVGLPMFLLLLRFGRVTPLTSATVGAFVGLVVTTVLRLPNLPSARDVLVLGTIGAVSALGFWAIWRIGRDHLS
jgi:hypothetical protein